ncbi:MAG: sigma-70 family RNA polymerase sigma factor [Myxococcota bacterium]
MRWLRRTRDTEEAFLEDVFVHADGLFRYAMRLCGDEDQADDLVQETLTRAFDAFGRCRPGTNHRAWAFTILRNTFFSRCRRAGRETDLPEPEGVADPAGRHPSDGMVRPDDGYLHGFDDRVVEALGHLSETQRTAVVLCDVEGMDYEEIARVMECPVGTVRSRIHHARKRLRKRLAGYARRNGYGGSDVAL